MHSREVREKFLKYFERHGHVRVPSSSLLPAGDETLLFTNAGMVQFKKVFTGEEKRPYTRATSCQKCMRAGGKHNDLENVGKTARHHTFFEMLGNFSFGDYFKEEAIAFAWELVTKEYGLPEERIYVTVYEKDDEAREIWKRVTGFPLERIVGLGEKDNFWSMGDVGPCGPCSEILFDQGEDFSCGRSDCGPWCDCDRYLEIWNLVFMQYNRREDGALEPLPRQCIDTGMGLERITAVLQGVRSNYETDLFQGLMNLAGKILPSSDEVARRVVSDHARASAFLIADGVFPTNEGRGYVLRRIIRRAVRFGWKWGARDPFLYKMAEKVIEEMGDIYPELVRRRDTIVKLVRNEEERFMETIERGMQSFFEVTSSLRQMGKRVIPGEAAFKLYDTYGFPVDLTRLMAEEEGFEVDEAGFEAEMRKQKERARMHWKGELEELALPEDALKLMQESSFVGYDTLRVSDTEILAILKDGQLLDALQKGERGEVLLRECPFYGTSGGQVADTGYISGDSVKAKVTGGRKVADVVLCQVEVVEGLLRKGSYVSAQVDEDRRRAIMRNHTATHLLHAALRKVLGEHVQQAGSLVEPERLRFDFSHYEALKGEELRRVENLVRGWILDNRPVRVMWTGIEEAKKMGAIALFDEKYGERVRVINVEGVSMELCGGTHVTATGEIGPFLIVSTSSVASGVRRITALTGWKAYNEFLNYKNILEEVEKSIGASSVEEVMIRLNSMRKRLKGLESEVKMLQNKLAGKGAGEDVKVEDVKGVRVVTGAFEGLDRKALGSLVDREKAEGKPSAVLFMSSRDGQVVSVCGVSVELTGTLDASELLREVSLFVKGTGGGRKDFAQGGGKDPSGIEKALEMFREKVRDKISQGIS